MSSRHTLSAANFGNLNHEKISHSSSKSISQSNETLENALSANRRLQRALRNEFLTVKESIHQNRAKVAHYTNLLLQKCSPISFQQQLNAHGRFTNRNRRWTRRFFVDHRGSEPSLNLDTLRRRKVEKETFFYHNQPSWSSKETAQLMAVVLTVLTPDETGNLMSPSSEKMPLDHSDDLATMQSRCLGKKRVDSIDFESVAKSLAPSIQCDGDYIAERHKRTAEECQIQYCNLKSEERNKSIFDNQENMRVLSEVVSLTSSTFGSTEMDWEMIADKTADALQLQPELHRLSGWDCLVTYYRKSKTPLVQLQTASTVWTSQEDELLLKYLAAAGPQTVIDSKNSLLQNTLLPLICRKSKKQVFTRVNQSLLNPNMTKNDWSEYEERRLIICMKIYYSLNQQDCNQIYCASTHCRGRGAKSVVDKWNRSINPDYSTRPFTREEDEALLQVMRSSISQNNASDCGNQHIGWVDLSHKFFPNRHPQRLQNRWSELATDQDIINRERAKLLKESSSNSAISDYGRKRRKLFHEL